MRPKMMLRGTSGEIGLRGRNPLFWTFAAAFVDGHSDMIYMNSHIQTRVMMDESLQDTYRCIIMRGEGWRKDTLPLPFVDLGITSTNQRPSYENCVEN